MLNLIFPSHWNVCLCFISVCPVSWGMRYSELLLVKHYSLQGATVLQVVCRQAKISIVILAGQVWVQGTGSVTWYLLAAAGRRKGSNSWKSGLTLPAQGTGSVIWCLLATEQENTFWGVLLKVHELDDFIFMSFVWFSWHLTSWSLMLKWSFVICDHPPLRFHLVSLVGTAVAHVWDQRVPWCCHQARGLDWHRQLDGWGYWGVCWDGGRLIVNMSFSVSFASSSSVLSFYLFLDDDDCCEDSKSSVYFHFMDRHANDW